MAENAPTPKYPFEHQPTEEERADLDELRKDMLALAADEKKKGHFVFVEKFNADELTVDDARIWKAIKDGSITMARILGYQNRLGNQPALSREAFVSIAAHRAMEVIVEREREEEKKKRQ